MDETTSRNTPDPRPSGSHGAGPAESGPIRPTPAPHDTSGPPVDREPSAVPAGDTAPPWRPDVGWSDPSGQPTHRDPWATRPLSATTAAANPPADTGDPNPRPADADGSATTPLPSQGTSAGHQVTSGGHQVTPGAAGGYPPPPGHAGGAYEHGSWGGSGGAAFAAPTEPAKPQPRRRGRTWLAALAIGAILGGGAGAATAMILDEDDAPATDSSLDPAEGDGNGATEEAAEAPVLSDVGEVADQVLPSVVSIQVMVPGGAGGGSGVIISADGQILTNNHVVQAVARGQGELTVTFDDGTTAAAEVVGTDPLTDLAVIQAQDVSGLTPAALGSSGDVTVGQQVVAIGSPLGLDGTVTTGIVSALDRTVEAGDGGRGESSIFSAIQTDAPINPGNSGGPLVNMSGEVIGINSAILTTGAASGSIGLGFSIPIDQAEPIAAELIENGEATHARIGVRVGNPQDGTRGALIAGVDAGSAAADAGVQEGDIVTRVDDHVIADGTTLVAVARSYRPGDEVTLTVLRDGEEITIDVTLGSDAETA